MDFRGLRVIRIGFHNISIVQQFTILDFFTMRKFVIPYPDYTYYPYSIE